jgi:hypothetical protein
MLLLLANGHFTERYFGTGPISKETSSGRLVWRQDAARREKSGVICVFFCVFVWFSAIAPVVLARKARPHLFGVVLTDCTLKEGLEKEKPTVEK